MCNAGSETPSGMKVLLFSNDEKLASSWRETVVEVFGTESKLEVGNTAPLPSGFDLCLWDFIPGQTAIPQGINPAKLRKHVFLVQCQHLPAFHKLTGGTNFNVLLKPVTSA